MNISNYFSFEDKTIINAKKFIFGFDDELEISKLVYAFFLDSYKPVKHAVNDTLKIEQKNKEISDLSNFEFFSGSLTWNRMKKEMAAFLESDLSKGLSASTRAILLEYVHLLEASQPISDRIDRLRSSELRLIFLSKAGIGLGSISDKIDIEAESLESLVALTLAQLNALNADQKALFLMGSNIHETLLCVERVDTDSYIVRYYDSNRSPREYSFQREFLFQEAFWTGLYNLKFSKEDSKELNNLFKEGESFTDDKDDHRRHPFQKKNTCHLQCHLHFLKDQIIRHSDPRLETAFTQWKVFKEAFGQFILKNEHLKDKQLLSLCYEQQEKRSVRTKQALSFHHCMEKGLEEQTINAYIFTIKSLMDRFFEKSGCGSPSGNLIIDLIHLENILLAMMEARLVPPEKLAPIFEEVNNPWVQETFERFKERYVQRQAHFQKRLQQEIDAHSTSSSFELWDPIHDQLNNWAMSLGLLEGNTEKEEALIPQAPIDPEQILKLLALFKENPELLHSLNQKPCLRSVLFQAILLGEVQQVESIINRLPEEDQKAFLKTVQEGLKGFYAFDFSLFIEKGLLQNLDSDLSIAVFMALWIASYQRKEFSKFIELTCELSPHLITSADGKRIDQLCERIEKDAFSREQILEILKTLESLQSSIEKRSYAIRIQKLLLSRIESTLMAPEQSDLFLQCKQFNFPAFNEVLERVHLMHLYSQSRFDELNLSLTKVKLTHGCCSSLSCPFNDVNFAYGLDLLKSVKCPVFGSLIMRDLWKGSYQNEWQVRNAIISCYCELKSRVLASAIRNAIEFDTLLSLLTFLIKNSDQKGYFKFASSILKSLEDRSDKTNRTQKYQAISETLERFSPDLIRPLIISMGTSLADYYWDNPSNQYFLVRMNRAYLCHHYIESFLTNEQEISKEANPDSLEFNEHYRGVLAGDFERKWELLEDHLIKASPAELYQNVFKPIFGKEFCVSRYKEWSLQGISFLFERVPSLEQYRKYIALVRLEEGNKEEALAIFPDEEALNQLLTVVKI